MSLIKSLSKFGTFHEMLQEHQASAVKKGPVVANHLLKMLDTYWTLELPYDDQLHESMLVLCNQSIAFAPMNSVQLARAYEVRSMLLSRLNFNQNKESKGVKVNFRSDGFQGFTPSETIPCVAECVSINSSLRFGRQLVANRDIEAEEIVMVEDGFAMLPKKEYTYLLCSQCLCIAWNAVPCGACPLVIYCSEHCRTSAWENHHQVECKLLPSIYVKSDSSNWNMSISITALRCFLSSIKVEGLETVLREAQAIDNEKDACLESLMSEQCVGVNNFKSLYRLATDKEILNIDRINKSSEFLVDMLLQFSNVLHNCTELDEVRKILAKLSLIVKINHLKYQGSACDYIHDCCSLNCDSIKGYFISTCSSLVNHSCTPNIGKVFIPERKIVMFAARSIKKGEQLCITYGPTLARILNPERIALLYKDYNVICLCQACTQECHPCDCLGQKSENKKDFMYELYRRLNNKRLALEKKLFQQYGENYEIPDDCRE
ncbi:hypothetical protein TSAR_016597 [Trichomalopsis sarcophagae]|uniref:SET domain-containing protein n=1 Tax=Trichomalopsis sarcophagae TaxID=543379 RepID=A0A232EXV2_9HYME|nr:hypothetical protein TSAR_016597 [Trichomalopsis sarcophagae]